MRKEGDQYFNYETWRRGGEFPVYRSLEEALLKYVSKNVTELVSAAYSQFVSDENKCPLILDLQRFDVNPSRWNAAVKPQALRKGLVKCGFSVEDVSNPVSVRVTRVGKGSGYIILPQVYDGDVRILLESYGLETNFWLKDQFSLDRFCGKNGVVAYVEEPCVWYYDNAIPLGMFYVYIRGLNDETNFNVYRIPFYVSESPYLSNPKLVIHSSKVGNFDVVKILGDVYYSDIISDIIPFLKNHIEELVCLIFVKREQSGGELDTILDPFAPFPGYMLVQKKGWWGLPNRDGYCFELPISFPRNLKDLERLSKIFELSGMQYEPLELRDKAYTGETMKLAYDTEPKAYTGETKKLVAPVRSFTDMLRKLGMI
ncbi:MAG: hypothetical protein NZM26_02055 [Patescibacteria group bacterium]|nr:hypothetical protein [Patescibacteria group bacterium]